MFIADVDRTYNRLPIEPAGTERWWAQYAVSLDLPEGTEVHVHGKIQFKCYEPFAVECRIGLFISPSLTNPITSPDDILHPITGANAHPEVGDKYLVLSEQVYFYCPAGVQFLYLRVSMRSTAAVSTSRMDFGNGLLQAKY